MEAGAGAGAGHGFLRGGGKAAYPHPFSKSQMECLTAICDSIVPAIEPQPESPAVNNSAARVDPSEAVKRFYRLSGSENGVPEHVAGLIAKNVIQLGITIAWTMLWLLSTRLGTFLLCGRASLSGAFPYVQRFAAVPRWKREKILYDWGNDTGFALGSLLSLSFKLFKSICLFAFYSLEGPDGTNPTWPAIGYARPHESLGTGARVLGGGVIDDSGGASKLKQLLEDAEKFTVTEESLECRNLMLKKRISPAGKCMKVECDVVVVGSGSGGGVAAGVLAQEGYSVLVLEKGKYHAGHDLSLSEGPSLDKMYQSGCMLTTLDCGVVVLAGATVGGGSTINWSACIRTPAHVLKEWTNEHGLRFFGEEEYEIAMDTVCARLGVVNGCEKEGFQNVVLRKGCQKLGYNVENVPRNNSADHYSCGGFCNLGCKSGKKKGTAETWLVDAVAAGARVLAGCKALAVVHAPGIHSLKQNRAKGVLARLGQGQDHVFVQARVVVVASGALGTPPLLQASGLRNRNIGKNLHLHPVRVAWGYFPPGDEPDGKCYEGDIISSMCKIEGSSAMIQTPIFHPGAFSSWSPWVSGRDMKERMVRYSRTASLFALVRDKGSGRVWKENYLSYKVDEGSHDGENLARGLERALRILIAAGAAEVGTHRMDGERFNVAEARQEEIEDFLGKVRRKSKFSTPHFSAHQMGSCRMGMDPATSCVDENGESWEVEGLFVSDASVLPTALGVNPMITVESVSFCISRRVSRFLRRTTP